MNISDARKTHHACLRAENLRWKRAVEVIREAEREGLETWYGDTSCFILVKDSIKLTTALSLFYRIFGKRFYLDDMIDKKEFYYKNKDISGFYILLRRP